MFEKEATKYATIRWDKSQDPRDVFIPVIDKTKFIDWRNGAEFGYNKGKNEAKEIIKDLLGFVYAHGNFSGDIFDKAMQFLNDSEVKEK